MLHINVDHPLSGLQAVVSSARRQHGARTARIVQDRPQANFPVFI